MGSLDSNHWPPTVGEWGDFIGGTGTLLALVWAIGGFMFNDMQIRETQKDIQDQLEIFRSAVGSLTYIAASMQVNAADILAESKPKITPLGSLNLEQTSRMTVPARGKKGAINFRNDGHPVTLNSVESKAGDWSVTLSPRGVVRQGCTFQLQLETQDSIADGGPVHVVVRFETYLSVGGWFDIRMECAGLHVAVGEMHMGLPPATA